MKSTFTNKFIITILIIELFFPLIYSINLSCSTDSDCSATTPSHSICGPLSKCICDAGYIVTCNIPATAITNTNLNTNINQQFTYFTITPQSLDTYLTFKFILSTSSASPIPMTLSLWGDSGYLNNLLPSAAIQSINTVLNPGEKSILQTQYYSFSTQPNGQSQYLILGIQVISLTAITYPLTIYVTQQQAFDEDVFKIIITVLLSILSISCLILLIFCIYNRHRLRALNQRIQKQKQVNNIQHFPKYMPIVSASRVNIPLQVCSVCLIEIISDDIIRVMLCRHLFHVNCIDQWCMKSINCPICRQEFDEENCKKILPNGLNLEEVSFIQQQSQENKNKINESNQMKRNTVQDNSQSIQDNTFININKQNQMNSNYKTQQRQRQIQMVQLSSIINNINNTSNDTYNSTNNNNNNKNYFATNNHNRLHKNYETQQSNQYSNDKNNNKNNKNMNKNHEDQQISQDVDVTQNISTLRKPIL